MKPIFDVECEACGHIFEERKRYEEPASDCPVCGSSFTKTVFKTVQVLDKARDPYDYIATGTVPDPKPIKSFANDKRSGGKDTT